jgi:O-antigen/teichoic acid export membrane protein
MIGMGWWGPLVAITIGMAIAVAAVFRRDWGDARLTLHREQVIKISQYGVPLSLTVALTIVIASSDRFLIDWFLGEEATGLYAVAVDFTSQTLTLLMMVINLAMYPVAVRAFEHHGREAAQEQMRENASLLLAVGVPCVVGLAVIAPGIAHVFLGASYREAAADIIPLVALGAFLAGLKAYHFDAAFQFVHRTIHQVWIVLFAAMLSIGLNLFAVPRWGIAGAAVSAVAAYSVSIVITAVVGRRHFVLPWPVRGSVIVLLAAAAMAGVLYPLRDYHSTAAVAAQIAGGALVYGLVLLGLNFTQLRDRLVRRCREWRATLVSEGSPKCEGV